MDSPESLTAPDSPLPVLPLRNHRSNTRDSLFLSHGPQRFAGTVAWRRSPIRKVTRQGFHLRWPVEQFVQLQPVFCTHPRKAFPPLQGRRVECPLENAIGTCDPDFSEEIHRNRTGGRKPGEVARPIVWVRNAGSFTQFRRDESLHFREMRSRRHQIQIARSVGEAEIPKQRAAANAPLETLQRRSEFLRETHGGREIHLLSGLAERRARCRMNLALYLSRLRSSDLLGLVQQTSEYMWHKPNFSVYSRSNTMPTLMATAADAALPGMIRQMRRFRPSSSRECLIIP